MLSIFLLKALSIRVESDLMNYMPIYGSEQHGILGSCHDITVHQTNAATQKPFEVSPQNMNSNDKSISLLKVGVFFCRMKVPLKSVSS